MSIDVYGAKYTNSSDFEPIIRIPRYNGLIPYIGNLIRPHKEKAHHLLTAGSNSICVATETTLGIYQTVAMMTGYENQPMAQIVHKPDGGEAQIVNVLGNGALGGEIIAQQIMGENIFSVGIDVQEKFSGRPPVFTRSIVRYTPRILATAEKIVSLLQTNASYLND